MRAVNEFIMTRFVEREIFFLRRLVGVYYQIVSHVELK